LQNKLENLENVFIGSAIARDGAVDLSKRNNHVNGGQKEGLQ